MTELTQEFRTKFKHGDALNDLKNISEKMTTEEFIKFSNVVMKTAYDMNKPKAVAYMLSFYEKNTPQLLMRIHLQRMLSDNNNEKQNITMLKTLIKNFSIEFCSEIIDSFINYHSNNKNLEKYKIKKNEILKIILEETLIEKEEKQKKIKI